jgi:hypothetical protein
MEEKVKAEVPFGTKTSPFYALSAFMAVAAVSGR